MTQILELESEGELAEAQEFLDEALLDDLKRMRGERWDGSEPEEKKKTDRKDR